MSKEEIAELSLEIFKVYDDKFFLITDQQAALLAFIIFSLGAQLGAYLMARKARK